MNDPQWIEFALNTASAVGFETQLVEASPIGEDFAFYQQKIPGVFIMIGSGGPYALHHPKFKIDDTVLFPSAYYLFRLAEGYLQSVSTSQD